MNVVDQKLLCPHCGVQFQLNPNGTKPYEDGPLSKVDSPQGFTEYSLFCEAAKDVDRCIQEGEPLTERHERMLREIVYSDMSVDELVKVLAWMFQCKNSDCCKILGKAILQVLYDRQYCRKSGESGRFIIIMGGLVRWGQQRSVLAAKITDGHLSAFKTLNNLLNTSVCAGGSVAHLGFVFLCGGREEYAGPSLRTCWIYNPTERKRYDIPPMSKGRRDFTLHVLPSGRYIMAVGGWGEGWPLSDCEQFDLVTQTWRRTHPLSEARWNHAGVVCDDALYVTGGERRGSPPTDTVCLYDEATDTWQEAPPMLDRRMGHSAGTIPGSVVVCGGVTRAGRSSPNVIDVLSVEKFDTATRQWTIISHLHLGQSFTHGVCADNLLFLVGGERHKGDGQRVPISDMTIVDMADGTVTMETCKIPALSRPAVCEIDLPWSCHNH